MGECIYRQSEGAAGVFGYQKEGVGATCALKLLCVEGGDKSCNHLEAEEKQCPVYDELIDTADKINERNINKIFKSK